MEHVPSSHRPADADPDKNYCQCGCGTEIAWKRRDGQPRHYVHRSHYLRQRRHDAMGVRADRIKETFPDTEWTADQLNALTAENVQRMPDNLLYGMLRWYASKGSPIREDQIRLLADEARRRPTIGASVEHWIKRLLPSVCSVCHEKPGHYIVNRETFCRDCVTVGQSMRQRWGATYGAKYVITAAEADARLRARDAADRHHKARGRRR